MSVRAAPGGEIADDIERKRPTALRVGRFYLEAAVQAGTRLSTSQKASGAPPQCQKL